MLHLIRIIMFVVYEQLPQSLLSTHFQKLFCLICISSSSILFPRKVFFLCCFVFFPVAQKFPTLSPYPLSSYSGRLLKAFFFPHCCFVFWDMQICLSPAPLYFKQHFKQKLWDLNYANQHHQTPELQGVPHAITPSNPLPTKTPLHFTVNTNNIPWLACEHQICDKMDYATSVIT